MKYVRFSDTMLHDDLRLADLSRQAVGFPRAKA